MTRYVHFSCWDTRQLCITDLEFRLEDLGRLVRSDTPRLWKEDTNQGKATYLALGIELRLQI